MQPGCNFCGKTRFQAKLLIAGAWHANAYICSECVAACMVILREHKRAKKAGGGWKLGRLPKPEETT